MNSPLTQCRIQLISALLQLPLREKCPNTEFFLVHIFPHSDVFSPNAGKYGPEKTPYLERYEVSLRIQSDCGKIRTRKNSVFGHFSHSVRLIQESPGLNPDWLGEIDLLSVTRWIAHCKSDAQTFCCKLEVRK